MRRDIPRPLTRGALLILTGLACALAAPAGVLADGREGYAGSETCLECHEDMAANYARTVHGRLRPYQYPGEAEGCESCHGPGAVHAESGDPADIRHPLADQGNDGVAACLACHKTGHTLDWATSVHAAADVACLSCHQMHGDGSQHALLADSEEKVCFTCHLDAAAKFRLPSHHPLREGFMTCTSCHGVHGEAFQGITVGEPTREACLECHAEHAGPFVFEHSPVSEDCNICHDVHGTVANNLLRQNEPFLCLQCHQPHFHSILAGYEGDYSTPPGTAAAAPEYTGLSGTSHYDSMKRVMLTKCTQCHQSIHGSDLPSQSVTGQGRALNR
jgi:DmsE family decaheme c-type cytochrome